MTGEKLLMPNAREIRARRFAAQIMGVLDDFIPNNAETKTRAHEVLFDMAYKSNAAIVCVPPEWDALSEIQIRMAMLERAIDPRKFPETHCSQCGGAFGPGDSGYSHCRDHAKEV